MYKPQIKVFKYIHYSSITKAEQKKLASAHLEQK